MQKEEVLMLKTPIPVPDDNPDPGPDYVPHSWDIKRIPLHTVCGRRAVWVHEIVQDHPDLRSLRVRCEFCQQILIPEEVDYVSTK